MAGIIMTTTITAIMTTAEKKVMILFIFPLDMNAWLSSEYTNRQ
jgi:hypothetical protein